MRQIKMMRFSACAAAVALGAAGTAFAAELAHRWSFNGDYSDSAGGADAAKCGTYVSLYGGRVHMGYGACSHGTGYVNLGTNMLDTTAATIEIWARHDGVKSWSRIFDYGADDAHYFQMPWTYGTTLGSDSVGAKNGGAETSVANTMAPYELGTDYHIAVTFQRSGEATVVRWQRRDAATGELQKSGTLTMPAGIHGFVDPVLYLGHSQYAADRDALAAYDEVRLWRGVLSDAQLAASAAAGPDAAIIVAADVPQFTPAEPPDPPAQRAAVPNGGFRMMTYNINYAYDAATQTIIEDRIADRIIRENPDFCCLNEIRDTVGHPEATVLAKLTGMHKTFYGEGSQGNCVLSKEEPVSWKWTALSYAGYKRFLVVAEFDNVIVAATHLEQAGTETISAHDARMASIREIRESLAQYAESGKPIFLCGDWNAGPGSDEIALMKEFMTIISPTNGVRTYHGRNATGGSIIDYIAVDTAHADDIYTACAYVIDDIAASDHNPVFAEIYLRPAASTLGWIDERFLTTGRTGTWSQPVAYDRQAMKAELRGENVFTPNTPSDGERVTLTTTVAFDAIPTEESVLKDGEQGAIWLGVNGCFQVWTRLRQGSGGQAGWIDVEADGVMPATGVDYTFRIIFDYTSKTYSVDVKTGLTGFARLKEKNPVNPESPVQNFPLATTVTSISKVCFMGDGVFTSLLGEDVAVTGFSAAETVVLKENASVVLDAAKAKWLNSCAGGKAAVGSAAAGLSAQEFADAYLLNLDITEGDRSYSFEITDVDVGAETVTVAVKLTRSGNIAQSINGTLKFYGAATLDAFKNPALQPISSATVSDNDFSDGDTATAAFPKVDGSAVNTFFKAKIEER